MLLWNGVNMPGTLIKELLFSKKEKFLKTGNYTLIGVVFSIILDHWDVFQLDKIPIPHFVDFMYISIGINVSAFSVFLYLEKRSRVAAICPECGNELEIVKNFKCSDCGVLKFNKTH